MGKKRERSQPRVRFSPTRTVANLTDDFMRTLQIPELPDQVPARLEEALRRRIQAYFFYLREAAKDRFVAAIEIRLVRDTQRAVLTAYELGLADREVYYAEFRRLVQDLGFERVDVGFVKSD